jgi:hypothetical protein
MQRKQGVAGTCLLVAQLRIKHRHNAQGRILHKT